MKQTEAAQEQQNMAHGGGYGPPKVDGREFLPSEPPKVDLPPAGDVDNLKAATKSIEHCVVWLEKLPAGDWRSWALRMVEATIKAHESKPAPADPGAAVK